MNSSKADPLYASSMQTSMLMPVLRGDSPQPYVQQFQWGFKQEVDWNKFQQAWHFVFSRHDIFFQRFKVVANGRLSLQETPTPQVSIQKLNWSRLSAKTKRRQLTAFLKDDLNTGFNLENPVLCRLTLIQIEKKQYELIWTSHHALFDGRGRLILIREFLKVYQSFSDDRQLQLPRAARYVEYLRWIQTRKWRSSRKYWKQELKGIGEATPLHFGLDSNPPHSTQPPPSIADHFLSHHFTRKLHQWSKANSLSLNILVQAAWGIYLSRISGKETVLFAAPRSCRNSNVPDAPDTVGLFVNTVPVVIRILRTDTIFKLLQRIRRNWLRMRDHENTPIDLIKQSSEFPADKALFSSLAGYEKYQLNQLIQAKDGEYRFKLVGFTDLPLALQLQDGKRIKVEISYNTNQFSATAINRAMASFVTILTQLVEDSSAPVSTIRLLDGNELKRITKISTGKRPIIPKEPVHRVFEETVLRYPDRTAVRFEGRSISYQDLNTRANRLARFLKTEGVKAGTHVGLFLRRSDLFTIGQLAVLKLGAVYIPYDVEYPKDRLRWMIKDANPTLILASSDLSSDLEDIGISALFIDKESERWRTRSSHNLPGNLTWDSPAYIMYTSGSTGRPKGVVVPHRGIVRLVVKPNFLKLSSKTRTLQLAPVSFDASTFETWAPLLNGGACILYPERIPSIPTLDQILKVESVNTLWLTASLFNFIVDAAPAVLRPVKQILVGGEVLSPKHIKRAQSQLPDTRLTNGYGPTENTTFSCCYRIPPDHPESIPIPIGTPINHSSAFVLDAEMRMLPPGVSGELFVGGSGVALGYLTNAGLTKKRFVRNPIPQSKDPVLYRTGDRVFQRPDGQIEYLGRFDDQIKIRGHRIEPSEIQTRLLKLNGIKDGTVLVSKNNRGENELVGFVVPRSGFSRDPQRIKTELSHQLPEYMVPTRIEIIRSIPLTANGKINRAELFKMVKTVRKVGTHQKVILGETEEMVWNIWKEVLGKAPVNLEESFYEAGGQSLLATNLIFNIEKTYALKLPFSVFLKLATVKKIASWIDGQVSKKTSSNQDTPLTVKPVKTDPISELSIRWRTAYIDNIRNPDSTATNHIARGIILEGKLKPQIFIRAMEHAFNLHDRFRTHAVVIDGKHFEKVEPYIPLKVVRENLSNLTPKEALRQVEALYEKVSETNVRMDKSPLYTVRLLRLPEGKHFLCLSINHAIADGHSLGLFLKQTSQAYKDLLQKAPISVTPPKFSYTQYEKSMNKWLENGNRERIHSYWKNRIRGVKPIDFPFQKKNLPRKATWNLYDHYEFKEPWASRIRSFIEREGISTYLFFTTTVKWLIARYTGNLDSYIASGINVRSGPEEEEIAGEISNVILLRNTLKQSTKFSDQLQLDKQSLYEAMDHKHISVGAIPEVASSPAANIYSIGGQCRVSDAPDLEGDLQLPGIRTITWLRKKSPALMRLGFVIREPRDRLLLSIQYAPEIFVAHGVERAFHNLQWFLRIILDNPDVRLDELPDLSTPSAFKKPVSTTEKRTSLLTPIQAIICESSTGTNEQTPHSDRRKHPEDLTTRTLKKLGGLWEEVLGKAPKRVDEDFFDAGGHSLSAAHLFHRIEKVFSVNLTFKDFKTHGTLASLARWIAGQQSNRPSSRHAKRFSIKPDKIPKINDLSIKWRAYLMKDILDPENTQSLMISRGIVLEGSLRVNLLRRAINHVINMHERLRTHAIEIQGEYFEKIETKAQVKLPVRDLTGQPDEWAWAEARAEFEKECTTDLNIHHSPLLRFKLLRVKRKTHLLAVVVHHGVADGISMEVFYKQLSQTYNDLLNNKPLSVTPPKFSYLQFERSVEAWLAEGEEEKAKRYWEKLLGNVQSIDYPFLTKKIPDTIKWTHYDHYEFDREWVNKIEAFIECHPMSTFVFFTTLIKMLVGRYTHQLDSYASSVVDLRTNTEQAPIIGDACNLSFIRNRLSKTRSFLQQTKKDREAIYNSLDHKYFPPDRIDSQVNDVTPFYHKPFGQLNIIQGPDTGESLQLQGITHTFLSRRKLGGIVRLGFIIRQPKDRLLITFAYSPEIYVANSVERLKCNFQWFVRLILDNPAITLDQLPDLSTPNTFKKALTPMEKRSFILKPLQ